MKQRLVFTSFSMLFGFMLVLSFTAMNVAVSPPTASAQTALNQCNGSDNVGGQAVECHYVVTNNLDGTTTSSSITITECHGAANDPSTLSCNTSSTGSTDLVTTVTQCNGSGNGGGGTVLCTVDVVNNVTGTVTPTSATVNQCNEAGEGGGTAPTTACNPFPANTTGATVTQCNGSGNGGGGTTRVQCSVNAGSTTTSMLTVTVNQCVGSGNGGGATVTCRTGITNNMTEPSQPSPTPTPPTGTPTPTNTPPPGTGGGGNGPGGDGTGTGNGLGAAQVNPVPQGGVNTGGGSTSGIEHLALLVFGSLLLAGGTASFALRRVADRSA